MPFSVRLYQRFPVYCSVTYHAGRLLFKLPLASSSCFVGSKRGREHFLAAVSTATCLNYTVENKGVGSLYFGTRYNSNLLTEGLR